MMVASLQFSEIFFYGIFAQAKVKLKYTKAVHKEKEEW